MSNPFPQVSPPPTRWGGVPRALWIGGGVLGLATAALAGALITRSIDAPAAALTSATSAEMAAPATEAAAPVQHAATATTHAQTAQPTRKAANEAPAAVVCTNCGTVESVRAVEQEGQGTGLGAIAGGVVGGLLGNQFGGGKGNTAMTVLGAVGGGVAGHQVEKKVRSETVYNVGVRMHDGSVGTFRQAQPYAVGTKVVIDGKTLRMAGDAAAQEAK